MIREVVLFLVTFRREIFPCCGEEGKSECSTVVGDCGLDETGSVRVGVICYLGGFGLQYLDESFDLGIGEGVGDL